MPKRFSQHLAHRALVTLLCATPIITSIGGSAAAALAQPALAGAVTVNYAARQQFVDAQAALRSGSPARANPLMQNLEGYVLWPYLEYERLRRTLTSASAQDVHRFFKRYPDLPVTPLLRSRWLHYLGQHRLWDAYLSDYEPRASADLQCYHLRARLARGDRDALDAVAPLWTVGESQPKACDPLFSRWIKAGRLTESMVWERLDLALKANDRSLARYLLTLFSDTGRPWGDLLYRAFSRPQTISPDGLLASASERGETVVLTALNRLARLNELDTAERVWSDFADWSVAADTRAAAERQLLLERAEQGIFPANIERRPDPEAIADLARRAVMRQDWARVIEYIEALPVDGRAEDRWQYWLARALEQTYGLNERTLRTYDSLALERSYYGFLAAERRSQPPQLNEQSSPPDPRAMAALAARPTAQRALELLAVGQNAAAKREWLALLQSVDPDEAAAAAHLALDIGWLRQTIAAANTAGLRNDLGLRFPIGHMTEYRRMSHATGVPTTLLLAITRQESAFDDRARSSANARGLMQLLPSTAAWVANRAGLAKPTTTALYRPSTNIEIASHYLAFLLDRFNGSRPLAAAAYNAGERRVDQWIKTADQLPMDVWIESIPFRETRNYVQNVLAFSQVYSSRLAVTAPTLYPGEQLVSGPRRTGSTQQTGQ